MAKKAKIGLKTAKSTLVAVTKLLCFYLPDILELLREKFPLKYASKEFVTDLAVEADVVQELPEPQARTAPRIKTRVSMVSISQDAMTNAGFLTQYIRTGFPAEEVASLLTQATISLYYEKVSQRNWDSTEKMLSGMISFMEENREVLETKGSMPPKFKDETATLNAQFKVAKEDFSTLNSTSQDETSDIDKDINALYKRVIDVLKDAQVVFRKDAEKRTFYTFAALERLAVPGKRTIGGLRSGLIDAISKRPIDDAVIRTDYFNKSTKSDKKGRFELKPLPEGEYSIEIEAKGYAKKVVAGIKVKTGIMATVKKIALERLPEGEGANAG